MRKGVRTTLLRAEPGDDAENSKREVDYTNDNECNNGYLVKWVDGLGDCVSIYPELDCSSPCDDTADGRPHPIFPDNVLRHIRVALLILVAIDRINCIIEKANLIQDNKCDREALDTLALVVQNKLWDVAEGPCDQENNTEYLRYNLKDIFVHFV